VVRFLVVMAALCVGVSLQAAEVGGSGGIAAKYPGDRGIAQDPDVIFADDFEAWTEDGTQPPEGKRWGVRRNQVSLTHVIPGKVTIGEGSGPGSGVLEVSCWTTGSGSQTGGLSLKLGNYNDAKEGLGDGYDEVYIRHYIKFDENYRAVRNHGSNLGGRDVTKPDSNWVGMAAVPDPSTRGYFYSGLQPRGERGSQLLTMGFYSYHLDKGGQWGAGYEPLKRIPVHVGRWYCVERHMKLNSIDPAKGQGNFDGMEELWVDGELSIRKEGLRFRHVPQLHITFFTLETYYHGLPPEFGKENPIRVYYDNLVIARKPIGPMAPAKGR